MDNTREWTIREKLALATVLCRFGSQYWNFVSKYVVNICKQLQDIDESFYSPKNCAVQYSKLLENEDYLPSSKRGHKTSFETCEQRLVKVLTVNRIRELSAKVFSDYQKHENLVKMYEIVEKNESGSKLAKICDMLHECNEITLEEAFEEVYHISASSAIITPEVNDNCNEEHDSQKSIKIITNLLQSDDSPDTKSMRKKLSIDGLIGSTPNPNTTMTRSKRKVQQINWSYLLDSDGDDSDASNKHSFNKKPVRPKYQSAVSRSELSKVSREPSSSELEKRSVIDESSHSNSITESASSSHENVSISLPSLKPISDTTCEPSKFNKFEKFVDDSSKAIDANQTSSLLGEKRKMPAENIQTTGTLDLSVTKKFKTSHQIVKAPKPISSRPGSKVTASISKSDKKNFNEHLIVTEATSTDGLKPSALLSSTKKKIKVRCSESESPSSVSSTEVKHELPINQQSSASSPNDFLFSDPSNMCNLSIFTENFALGCLNNSELDETATKIWKRSVMLLWKTFSDHRHSAIFSQPVTEDRAPGYKDVILCPMDLGTIRKNIENGTLKNVFEFHRDIKLMLQNCFMYNSTDSDFYHMALEFSQFVTEQMKNFFKTQIAIPINDAESKSHRASRTRKKSAF